MKTNRFEATARAQTVMLQIAVLPMTFVMTLVTMAQAAPLADGQRVPAIARPVEVSNSTAQISKPHRAATSGLRFGKRARGVRASCPSPRGMKLNVRAYFDVTDADDGFRDNVVEVHGELLFNNWTIWRIARQNAADKRKNSSMNAGDFTFNVLFNDAETWTMAVRGFLSDRDKGIANNDDTMWNPRRQRRIIDIKRIYESGGQGGRNGIYRWSGDRDSENANLTLVVSKVGDIP